MITAPTTARARLASGAYLPSSGQKYTAQLEDALLKTIAAEPIEKMIRKGMHEGFIKGYTPFKLAEAAVQQGIITQSQFDLWQQAEIARQEVIAVDDFAPEDLTHGMSHASE